jgi:hypothetical protein
MKSDTTDAETLAPAPETAKAAKKMKAWEEPEPQQLEVPRPYKKPRNHGVVPEMTPEQLIAQKQLAAAKAKQASKKQARFEAIDLSRQWFIRCAQCDLPGIYLTRHPAHDTHFESGEWFSEYKALATPWMSNSFPCQNCRTPLRVTPHGIGEFVIGENQMRFVDSDESREEREKKAQDQIDEIKLAKSVPTVQIARGGKS